MAREEEIIETAKFIYSPSSGIPQSLPMRVGFIEGAKWADETMIEKFCKCYCDDLCEKGRCGMCYYKHDENQQIVNTFKYNECENLKLIRSLVK